MNRDAKPQAFDKGRPSSSRAVGNLCVLGAVAMAAAYLVAAFHPASVSLADSREPHSPLTFGFDRFRRLGPGGAALAMSAIASILIAIQARREPLERLVSRLSRWLFARKRRMAAVALLCVPVFFLLRNEFINSDGQRFERTFPDYKAARGFFANHDELWESGLHYMLWAMLHPRWGWSAADVYQAASSLAGGVFIFLLLLYGKAICPERALSLALLVCSGGFMQLFFGDVENYTLTGALILLYLYVSALHLRGSVSVLLPGVTLAVAMTFHLLCGFLLPSLALLWLRAWRDGRRGDVGMSILCAELIFLLTLIFFDSKGAAWWFLFHDSHASGHGGNYAEVLATPSWRHLWEQVNLLALLFPGWWLIAPLLAFRAIRGDWIDRHLAVATVFLLALHFAWRPTLGVYYDWNLFANVALPFSILVWTSLLRALPPGPLPLGAVGLGLLFAAHSYTWIVFNHFAP